MSISSKTCNAVLALTRLGIGHDAPQLTEAVDWAEIEAVAKQHGLTAVVLDGIGEFRKHDPQIDIPTRQQFAQWIGKVMKNYERKCEKYRNTISEMAGFYNSHGFKMMIVKGYACSLNWPRPDHRPCGDIDIWLFGRQKEADEALTRDAGIKVNSDYHHHTVFYWKEAMVENHYDFINVHHHKSHIGFEAILKDLGKDDSYSTEVFGEKVYLPSPALHALFLLKHNMLHFATEGLILRQLLDWAFFVKAYGKELDWPWLTGVLEKYGMMPAFNIFNAICIEDLGFDASLFPAAEVDKALKDRVLNDIFNPEVPKGLPSGLLSRVIYKFRRWRANAWKHRLCYNDSMWSAFWRGLWGHLIKPSMI